MRSLIIGGAGYIGTHLAEHLLDQDHDVYVIDSHVYGVEQLRRVLPEVKACVGDAQNVQWMNCFFKTHLPFDEVYFLAADATMYTKRTYREAAKDCYRLAHDHAVARFVFTSTCMVYGAGHCAPIAENQLLQTSNFYARDKLRSEHGMEFIATQFHSETKLFNFRLFNVAGYSKRLHNERFNNDHLLTRLVHAHTHNGSIAVHGDGTCVRDYVHVRDVVKILAQQDAHPMPDIPHGNVYTYNIGTGHGTNVLQATQQATAHFGKSIPTAHVDMRPDDITYLVANTARLKEAGYHIPVAHTVSEFMDLRQGRD